VPINGNSQRLTAVVAIFCWQYMFVCRTKACVSTGWMANNISTVRKFFYTLSSSSICLLILVAFFWTGIKQTENAIVKTLYVKSDVSQDHREVEPLLCMFTTFKPNMAKLPVRLYYRFQRGLDC